MGSLLLIAVGAVAAVAAAATGFRGLLQRSRRKPVLEVRIDGPDGEVRRRLDVSGMDEQGRERLVDQWIARTPRADRPEDDSQDEPAPEPELPAGLNSHDTDADGLHDAVEQRLRSTSPLDADTDGDAITDTGEIAPIRSPLEGWNPDEDLVTNDDQHSAESDGVAPVARTSPYGRARESTDPDTDQEGLPDPEDSGHYNVEGPVAVGTGNVRSFRFLRPPPMVSLDDAVRKALGVEVRLGALGLVVPALRQGREDTVKVVISRADDSTAVVATFVAQSQVASVEPIQTSAIMYVDLTGPRFAIRRLNPPDGEQVVSETALWEFEVTPMAAGTQTLTVSASMRLPVPGVGEKTVGIPSLREEFRVEVDRLYASRAFLHRNWQWVGTSGIAVAAVVVAISKK